MGSKPSKLHGSKNDVVKVKKHNNTWHEFSMSNQRSDAKKVNTNRNKKKCMNDNVQRDEHGSNKHIHKSRISSSFTPSSVPEESIFSNSTRPHDQKLNNRINRNDNISNREIIETGDAASNDSFSNNLHARMLRGETYDGESQELNERPFHEEKVKRVPTRAHLRPPKSPDCLIADPDAEGDEYEYM